MGYSNRFEVEQALANALAKESPLGQGPVKITSIGHTLSDTVTNDEISQYIRWADESIDGVLSSIVRVPLKRINKGSFRLAMDVAAGDQSLVMQDASRFTAGDVLIIYQSAIEEENLVVPQDQCIASTTPEPPGNFKEPPDSRRVCLWLPLVHSYDMNLARVEKVSYPDPIPKISARIAAAYLYDRHYAAQVEGNSSDFGKVLRKQALGLLNMVLSGAIRLLLADANEYVGRRYYNQALDDVPSTKAEPGKTFITEE